MSDMFVCPICGAPLYLNVAKTLVYEIDPASGRAVGKPNYTTEDNRYISCSNGCVVELPDDLAEGTRSIGRLWKQRYGDG